MSALDILITEDDLTLDTVNDALRIDGKDSIAQDIRHMIRESGLLIAMIGERSKTVRKDICIKIEVLIGQDKRIVPGTEAVTEMTPGHINVKATVKDGF